MPKVYIDKDVYAAALERIDIIFSEFENIYVSFSGGKDSSVVTQLMADYARGNGRKFDVLYIDLEAQYKLTIDHVEEIKKEYSDVIRDFYWVALPISLRNSVSIVQPKWTCWDMEQKSKWVRELPECSINIENCPWEWFKEEMEFEDFILYFAGWYDEKYTGKKAAVIAIRADESLNRFRTIVSDKKVKYKDYHWTTMVKHRTKDLGVYNVFPIYDWKTQDIWGCVSQNNYLFNYVYELMYKNGLSIHEQRLCQPYGDDQRNGLDQFRFLEPDTWEKVLARVNGVNFGNIYCRTSLLGNIRSEKPKSITWQQYAVYLLESIYIYSPELAAHYYGKIKKFMEYWENEYGISVAMYPDEGDKSLEAKKKIASWRRIARAIEKNDFWLKRLSFTQTKLDVEKLEKLKNKYSKLVGDGSIGVDLKRVIGGFDET